MNLDEIEDLIRRYLSAGIAVVLILIAPLGAGEDPAPRNDPAVVTVTPTPDPTADPAPEDADEDDTPDPPESRDPGDDTGTGTGDGTGDQDLDDRSPADTAEPGIDDENDPADDTGSTDAPAEDGDPDDRDVGDSTAGDSTAGDSEAGDSEAGDSDTADSTADRDAPSTTTTTPRDPADPDTAPRSTTGTAPSAAENLGWGIPDQEDDFASGLSRWELYESPATAGQGARAPEAVIVRDGALTITGDASGTTGGMCWGQGQRYGRWEGRVRAPQSDPSYNALLLLWPDADDFPVGGEIDFMEMQDPTRQRTDFFLHHGAGDEQVNGQVEVDATQWHNWAVEWTPDAITAYVDGEQWFRSTDTETFPPGPMHLCIQLDWFPDGTGQVQESSMEVDWVRQYALEGS